MRVAVTGATGVLGRSVVPVLQRSGHEVVGFTRSGAKAAVLERAGVHAAVVDLFDHDRVTEHLVGCDAVVNLATRQPVGFDTLRRSAWRAQDRLRTDGVRTVCEAARAAGVRRVVQESVSTLYADQGSDWVTEESPVEITAATEPASVGESLVQDYADACRTGVVLRFGTLVGDDDATRWSLKAAAHRRPFGLGDPDGWAHVVHTDDLGPAVVAALEAPSGIYNVGADPVRRADLVSGFASAVGAPRGGNFFGPVMARLARTRVEPMGRSLRVSSSAFTGRTGWSPSRGSFDLSWFEAAGLARVAMR